MSRAVTSGQKPKLSLKTDVAPPRSQPYEIIAPAMFARTATNIRPVSGKSRPPSLLPSRTSNSHIPTDRDLEMLVRAFEKMAAASDELESTLGALKKLLRERAAAREKEECGLGLFGDAKPALSGRKVARMIGEWMEGVEEAKYWGGD